jgi:hypothetical protein
MNFRIMGTPFKVYSPTNLIKVVSNSTKEIKTKRFQGRGTPLSVLLTELKVGSKEPKNERNRYSKSK